MTEPPERILLVDDDESVRKALAAVLENKGYIVETAENGRQAIEKSKTGFYHLVLIDVRLPDMEGTRLLSEMRDTTPKMVKIIVTGYPSLENAVEAANKAADAYVIKPFNVDDLLSKIRESLDKQRDARRVTEQKVTEYIETRAGETDEAE